MLKIKKTVLVGVMLLLTTTTLVGCIDVKKYVKPASEDKTEVAELSGIEYTGYTHAIVPDADSESGYKKVKITKYRIREGHMIRVLTEDGMVYTGYDIVLCGEAK